MPKSDLVRLRHMQDAAQEALGFAVGCSRSDLDTNRQLVLALVKCIEIIGEAASQTGPDTRRSIPDLPWPAIVAMRHRLVHAYFDIDLDRLWDTVTDDLPGLADVLGQAIAAWPTGAS